ncbi:MAG: EAL domain-containing protein [Burkholderiaceae bacterium]|jgi:diguanylate cyclase (GGDEF)-like protein/PAS domain S-box-containing protein
MVAARDPLEQSVQSAFEQFAGLPLVGRVAKKVEELEDQTLAGARMVGHTEPLLFVLVCLSLCAGWYAHRVALQWPQYVAALVLLGALASALWEHRAGSRSVPGSVRVLRAAALAACAPLFGLAESPFQWGWFWLLGMAAVYPCGLSRNQSIALILALALYEPVIAIGRSSSITGAEMLIQLAALVSIGALSHAWGRALDASARAQHKVKTGEQRAQVVAAYSDVIMVFTDRCYRLAHVSQAVERTIGYSAAELRATWNLELVHPDERNRFLQERRHLLGHPGNSMVSRFRIRHANGHWVWLEVRITNLLEHPAVRGFFASATDASARVQAEQQLRSERTLLKTVVDYLPLSVYTKNRDGRYLMSNRANVERLGRGTELDVIGRRGVDLDGSFESQLFDDIDARVLETGEPVVEQELQTVRPDGNIRWYQTTKLPLLDSTGIVTGLVGIARDITENKTLQGVLLHQARHDPLTGLANRRYFTEQLAARLEEPHHGQAIVLIFCDLDLFKAINDRYGHEIGDEFLKVLGSRLSRFGREGGRILARFGGDEFVLLAALPAVEMALPLARRVLETVREPIVLGELVLQAAASVGVASLRPDHRRPEDLIRDADTAMYQAKAQGRNRVAFFDGVLRERAIRQSGLVQALRGALERRELTLIYQPKISLHNGRVSGFEALMRWDSPEYGSVPPHEFIPLAEESGLIVPFGTWALSRACEQLRRWQADHPRREHLNIAVNVSMRQLREERFVAEVVEILKRSRIYPTALELELTESAAMQNPDQSVELLRQLKNRGIRVALDDFGTGYSSLAYLQRLPVDVLKIDRAFVSGLASTSDDAAIVRLVIALARTLRIESVAEGIESQANAAEIKRLGCEFGQGFYFSHALNAREAAGLLDENPEYLVA